MQEGLMPRVAFVTFGILREPYGHPAVQGFVDRGGPVGDVATAHHGLIEGHYEPEDTSIGEYVTARFVTAELAGREAQTVSLWTDLDAVFAFAYSDRHAEALPHRREWSLPPACPTYAASWEADEHRPTWAEAAARLEHLHDHGSDPTAFDFRAPFDATGRPIRLSRRPADR